MLYGRQVLRNKENLNMFFLSPYAFAEETDDGVSVGRNDSDEAMLIGFTDKSKLMEAFKTIRDGIGQDELAALFSEIMKKEAAEEMIDLLICGGIIE